MRPLLADDAARPAFRRALLGWYARAARDLPWRRTRDPYRIWLSEIMLQQTRVETVQPYYERFLAALPDLPALAAAKPDDVLKLWEGLGYYARCRNLHAAARRIVTEHAGQFPQSFQAWRRLPGVGRYTAAAIASITRGEPVAALDGNIRRVLVRLFAVRARIDQKRTQDRLWALADGLLCRRQPGAFNQALMELGARVCRPRGPACGDCPVRRWCAAAAAGCEDKLPRRGARKPPPRVTAVAAVLRQDGRVLLVKRPAAGLLGGLWELPSGPRQAGQAAAEVLRSVLAELVGAEVAIEQVVTTVRHVFSHFTLDIEAHACRFVTERPPPGARGPARWVPVRRLGGYALTRVTRRILEAAPTA